jgi:superfamily II DNA or RNA helicase
MMKIEIQTPTKAYLKDVDSHTLSSIKKFLSYVNVSNLTQYKKTLNNQWFKQKNPVEWEAKCEELKEAINHCLVYTDRDGTYIRSGSVPYLIEAGIIPESSVENKIQYPSFKPMAWAHMPKYNLHPYQKSTVEKLINERHGCAVLCTGAGKTLAILTIARNMGLKTLIITPSQSIFSEMVENCEHHFGRGNVGMLGDGKKKTDKKITVCISKSITTLKPDSEHYNNIKSAQLLLVDETHLFAAESLEEICHGVLSDIPYRFFFTGTHTRGDGSVKLLESITGKVVETLSTKQAVEGGYISDHEFRIVKVESDKPKYKVSDPIAMKRAHFLRNSNISNFITKLSESVYNTKNEKTLVLVEELGQIADIIKVLKVPYAYAHSGTNKKELEKLGLKSVNVQDEVEKFNKGEVAILIGTSCISTGTNIYPVHHCVNWQGGSSEIKTKQGAVGRSVRKLSGSGYERFHPEKTKAVIWDFDVQNVPTMTQQLKNRIRYYKHSGTPIKEIG